MSLAEIVEQRPSAAVKERLLVVAESVKEIKHWIALRRVLRCARGIARGQVDAVVHRIFENSAIQRVAVDPALSMCWERNYQRHQQSHNLERAMHRFSLLVA